MNNGLLERIYNPDVLSCLANLSNDEVFTPPEVVNQMLDMLPQELFSNPDITFLDPATKTGVFLREIAKRLIKGLENQIPDLQARIDHIFHKQLFGIAITELTSLLARRGIYCSKYPNSDYSVTKFDNAQGNIRYKHINHQWEKGKCVFCGASQEQYERGGEMETHAYEWIHCIDPKEIFNMKFDVIIGNPPYQLSDGGAQASAKPIYNLFIEQAKKLKPTYLTMIIPSRWMTGGKGLDEFRKTMIHDKKIQILHDFVNSADVFNGVDIKGGVCYFLWARDSEDKCDIYLYDSTGVHHSKRYLTEDEEEVFIRYNQLVEIKNKVKELKEKSFDNIVSSRKPYGLPSDFFKDPIKYGLPKISKEKIPNGYSILGLENLKRVIRYIPKNYPLPKNEGIDKYKVFISESYGCGAIGEGPATPVLATPGELCTETFLQIGTFETKEEAENCISYIKTKFFRVLVGILKNTQHATQKVYHYVPLQDFTKPWTDEELYTKYKLSNEEIDFIESMIKPMEAGE